MTPYSNKLKDIVAFFKKELKGYYNENELQAICSIIFESKLNIKRQDIALNPEQRLNESHIVKIIKVIKRLKRYEPVQYITGFTDFLELTLKVKPPVLIPRPETEELVLWVEKELKSYTHNGISLLDIGTGSGCIALALKRRMPDVTVCGLDINAEAIAVAKDNARHYNLNVDFKEKDILTLHKDDPLREKKWDVWVSNPPYVRLSEREYMHDNVLKYESKEALFVDDHRPLIFYERISSLAIKSLKDGGIIFFEINEAMGQEIKRMLKNTGFINIIIKKDINGKDRFVRAVKRTR